MKNGAKLNHPAATAGVPAALEIELSGDLVLEAGATIDLTGLGYPAGARYPGRPRRAACRRQPPRPRRPRRRHHLRQPDPAAGERRRRGLRVGRRRRSQGEGPERGGRRRHLRQRRRALPRRRRRLGVDRRQRYDLRRRRDLGERRQLDQLRRRRRRRRDGASRCRRGSGAAARQAARDRRHLQQPAPGYGGAGTLLVKTRQPDSTATWSGTTIRTGPAPLGVAPGLGSGTALAGTTGANLVVGERPPRCRPSSPATGSRSRKRPAARSKASGGSPR